MSNMMKLSFTDYLFLPIFLLLAVVYYLIPKKGQWILLLIASILFYCSYGVRMLPVVCLAAICAYTGACIMQRRNDNMDAQIKAATDMAKEERKSLQARTKRGNKYILWAVLFCILGMLVYSKVQGFLGSSVFTPLGISYYSMSLTAYLADVYWKKERAERNPLRLLLYTLYFPKILEGPISRHRRLASQFEESHIFNYVEFCHGLQRMAWGYFKKLCIADRLSLFVTPVFADYHEYGGSVIVVAAIFSAFQLYCDFSGCMDIALGASHALGIDLEENFDHPFSSRTVPEFWRRWHITLGTWFKDYVYMPIVISPQLMRVMAFCSKRISKRFGKAVMSIVPLTIVWLLTGLWHGTGWNYIMWGMWWGILIMVSTVFEPEIRRLTTWLHIDVESNGYVMFQKVRTFLCFVVGRLITMTGRDIIHVLHWVVVRFEPWHLVDQSMYEYGLDRQNLWLAIILIVVLMVVEHRQQNGSLSAATIDERPIAVRWLIYLGLIFITLIVGVYGVGYDASSFAYMKY